MGVLKVRRRRRSQREQDPAQTPDWGSADANSKANAKRNSSA